MYKAARMVMMVFGVMIMATPAMAAGDGPVIPNLVGAGLIVLGAGLGLVELVDLRSKVWLVSQNWLVKFKPQ